MTHPTSFLMTDEQLWDQAPCEEDFSDPCPDCGTELEAAPRGGVKCPNKDCGYWFCY